MRADLHIHTKYSDGALWPREIIPLATRAGLAIIGLTDHDTADHFPESEEEGRKTDITVIPGIEFSTQAMDREIHIIGYALDCRDPALLSHLKLVRGRRTERAHLILKRLADQNVHIPAEELARLPSETIPGRVIIARLLIEYNYAGTINEAFDRYLNEKGRAFVPYELTDIREVIALINQCGGASVFAHPSLQELESIGPMLKEAGLEGVEAWRPGFTGRETRLIVQQASGLGLFLTGGSDWHFKENRFKLGDFYVKTSRIETFLDLIRSRRKKRAEVKDRH